MEIKAQMVQELAEEIFGAAMDVGYGKVAKEHGWNPEDFQLSYGDLEMLAGEQPGAPWSKECNELLHADQEAWEAMVVMVRATVRMGLTARGNHVLRQDG